MDVETIEKLKYAAFELEMVKKVVDKQDYNNFELSVVENGGNYQLPIPHKAQIYLREALKKAYDDLKKQFEEM